MMAHRTSTPWKGALARISWKCLFVLVPPPLSLHSSLLIFLKVFPLSCLLFRYDPKTNQWSSDVAPTSTCRTSVGVAVLGGYLYAVGGQDGVSCLNIVERYDKQLLM